MAVHNKYFFFKSVKGSPDDVLRDERGFMMTWVTAEEAVEAISEMHHTSRADMDDWELVTYTVSGSSD